MSYSRQWLENVQMHLCTYCMTYRELMQLCITLNGYTSASFEYHTFTFASRFYRFSVQYGIKKTAHGAFMHFYHSTDNIQCERTFTYCRYF